MGRLITARKIGESPDEVRYEFGLNKRYDRILVIDPRTMRARAENGDFNWVASAIAAKILKTRQVKGTFPASMIFVG
ncbi:hypothetical protein [Plantactinospora sp. KBS50]|uniref:hypothetical protein n=1 Tax=Plantactinospora sp. KBS50 TaxID=2024580 RepID=UPI000BAB0FA6|nr:hypothetical protein [Plantactinospora sp. KBS50]ASW54926.1 hypothetical protein CIK06_13130 [Plantactinospora sp. KBS50]